MESLGLDKYFWRGKNVLITGHTGFKGSWLSLWLTELGANVSGLSLVEPVSMPNMFEDLGIEKSISDKRGDIVNLDTCKNIMDETVPDILIHLAAQPLVRESYLNPLRTYKINVIGTANILEAARSCKAIKTILVVTTDKCYENVEKEYAYVETDSLGGYDPYSSSKACAEHVALAYYRSFFREQGVGLATARAGNVIGGGDWSADRLIPDVVRAFSQDKKLTIRYPHAIRPWQHVLEPLSGYLSLIEYLRENPEEFSGPWNFGPNQNSVKTVKDTVELAAQLWGSSSSWESSSENNPHEATLLQLNSKKAKSILSWKPRWDFNKAVSETIQWYKAFYFGSQDMQEMTLDQIAKYLSEKAYV